MAGGGDPNTTPPVGGGSGSTADAGTAGDGAAEPTPGTGPRLPPIADPGDTGELEIQVVETLPGLATHIMIAPQELGRDGLEHPVLVWINGAGANSSSYRNMHDNLAAQGFVIVDDKQSTFEAIPEIDSQRAAIDWVLAQTQDTSSPYHGKFDETRIAIGGHSLGSVASFGNVADPRITTSVHMAGGVTGNPGGVDNALIETLRAPTLFLCGSADTNGLGRVRDDFAAAPPAVPLFFGTLAGVGHTDEFSVENGGRWGRIVAAWLRWRLADDESAAALFAGDDCEFCTGDWTAMKRAL
jgi:dienelactone hydrolase